MLYREAGQFKTSYEADQAVFPIRQDRIAIALILLVAFVAVPLLASEYFLRAIFIPFLILSLAAIGLKVTGSGGRVAKFGFARLLRKLKYLNRRQVPSKRYHFEFSTLTRR